MEEGAHFTIDFIQEKYREQVKMLMEILCIDMKEAYDLFLESGCNTQNAINLKTNHIPPEEHHFQEPIRRNTRQRGQRNGGYQDFHQQLNNFYQSFQDDEDEDYHDLPVARRRPRNLPLSVEVETQFDAKFNQLLQNKRKKKTFLTSHAIRRQITQGDSQSIAQKIFNKKPKKPQERKILNLRPFFKQIEKGLLQKICHIKFGKGTMSESLQQCHATFQPLLAYHLNFDLQNKQDQKETTKTRRDKKVIKNKRMVIDITQDNPNEKMVQFEQKQEVNNISFTNSKRNSLFKCLLLDQKFMRLANQGFLNYVFDVQNYEFQAYLKEFFPKSCKKQSYLMILRVNVLEEIEMVGKINLDSLIQKIKQIDEKQIENILPEIIQQLKKYSDKSKLQQRQDDQLVQRYRLFQQGIYHYDYIKPPTTAQKRKIKQDQQIIKMQEQEFLNMQNQIIEQKIKQLVNQEPEKQKISKNSILQKRQKIRQKLTKYKDGDPNVMMVKFRLPNSKNIILTVSVKEKVSYLFDYIYSLQTQNIGFEEEQDGVFCERNFDIIRPEDRLSLQQKSQSSLEELFQGSTMQSVIVKQK